MLKAAGSSSSGFVLPSGGAAGSGAGLGVTDFNFGALDPVVEECESVPRERLHRVINAVCEWLYPGRARESTMLLRGYTLLWFLRPDWLGNPTQVELAARLGVTKQVLGKLINKFRNTFGFYVAGMRGEDAREKFRVNAMARAGELAEARRAAVKSRANVHHVSGKSACQVRKNRCV